MRPTGKQLLMEIPPDTPVAPPTQSGMSDNVRVGPPPGDDDRMLRNRPMVLNHTVEAGQTTSIPRSTGPGRSRSPAPSGLLSNGLPLASVRPKRHRWRAPDRGGRAGPARLARGCRKAQPRLAGSRHAYRPRESWPCGWHLHSRVTRRSSRRSTGRAARGWSMAGGAVLADRATLRGTGADRHHVVVIRADRADDGTLVVARVLSDVWSRSTKQTTWIPATKPGASTTTIASG